MMMDQTFIDRLCLRRLCLPSFTDIDDLRSGIVKTKRIAQIEFGCVHHIACLFERRCCLKALSYGTNLSDTGGGVGTTHAEATAIDNLPSRPRSKKLKSIYVL